MRILNFYYTDFSLIGGVETVVLGLAKAFAKRQCPAAIVELSTQWKPKRIVFDDVPLWSIDAPSFPTPSRPRSWASYLRALVQFELICHQFRPDIVHVHFPLSQCLPVVGAHFLPHRWRLVTTVHGGDVRWSPYADPRLQVWQARLFRRSDIVTSVSEGLLQDAIRLYPFISTKARIVYNGVESRWFDAQSPASDRGVRYALFVGRFYDAKALDVLLRTWSRIYVRLHGTELWLAGDGTDREKLLALAGELGITSSVRFLGWKSLAELPALYKGARFVVLPSRQEANPVVLLEAGACGAVRVATRIPGITEIITHGVTGFLAEPESPEALAQAMFQAASLSEEERRRISHATQESIRTNFTQEVAVSNYLTLYRGLIKSERIQKSPISRESELTVER